MRLFDDVISRIHDPLLRRAYELAEMGRGSTSPNPLVGCVIAQDDEIVGEGFHSYAGGPHAEAIALAQAGPRAAGGTAYVTLEPCNHFGKTPPCSETLVSRGIAGVVIGIADPNPVAVGGAVRLREAGIEVEFEPDHTPYEIQNEAWLHYVRTGRPFVQVKTALTLDGHAQFGEGHRSGITGADSRELTMRLRSAADAVLVGASTARIDAPTLVVRGSDQVVLERQPLRVVLGRSGVPDAALFRDGLGSAIALLPQGIAAPGDVEVVEYDLEGGLDAALEALALRGIVRVLIEAGPALLSALVSEGLAQEYVFLHAGGFAGPGAPAVFVGSPTHDGEALVPVLEPFESGIVGQSAVSVWRPVVLDTGRLKKGD